MKNRVKLYVYEEHPERTIIDVYETESFNDFTIVRADISEQEDADHLKGVLDALETGKKFVIVPNNLNITIYGVREEDDSRSISSELQYPTITGETT